MSDQAPVSSRHVKLKLMNLANIPERIIDDLEVTTEITRSDRARTTVQRPLVTMGMHNNPGEEQHRWDNEVLAALRYLEGFEGSIRMSMGRTFIVEWDGVCRPI